MRPFQLILAGLTLAVGSIAITELVTLGYQEHLRHRGAWWTLGWPVTSAIKLLMTQGSVLALAVCAAAPVVMAISEIPQGRSSKFPR